MAFSLAVAQTVPQPGEVSANRAEHLELARCATDEGASLVLFPELSLTGYELHRARDLAFKLDDVRLDPLRSHARESEATLVVGAPLSIAGRLHLAALILAADGNVSYYAKHHLGAFPSDVHPKGAVPPPEASVFAPGESHPFLDHDDRTAAFAICADVGRPQHVADAAKRGADVLLASMFYLPQDTELEHRRLRGYAREHAMLVAVANYGALTGGLPSGGRSAIWNESGDVLVQLSTDSRGIAVLAGGNARAIEW